MAKKLLSEQVVNRWAKLSGVKLNENYGAVGERDDEMGTDMAPEGDTGIEMADEAPPMEEPMGGEGEESITVEDDKLEAMLASIVEKAVQDALEKMGLGGEGEGVEGGDEDAGPDTDMEDLEGDEDEGAEEEEEALDEELEVVSDDEIINETLKRVIKRLVG